MYFLMYKIFTYFSNNGENIYKKFIYLSENLEICDNT